MNNKLVKTNNILYKIKKFFNKLFDKKKTDIINEVHDKKIISKDKISLLKDSFEESYNKKVLADKLLNAEIGTSELEESQIDEMKEFFVNDIENLDLEINKVKNNIIKMKKQLRV